MNCKTIYIEPMGKPRMTQRDKWLTPPRDCVKRYRRYSDAIKKAMKGVDLDDVYCVSWTCYLPIPKSWSKKKKAAMAGAYHKQKPDRDNIDKGILDSLFKDDSGVCAGVLRKYWDDGQGARIELRWI